MHTITGTRTHCTARPHGTGRCGEGRGGEGTNITAGPGVHVKRVHKRVHGCPHAQPVLFATLIHACICMESVALLHEESLPYEGVSHSLLQRPALLLWDACHPSYFNRPACLRCAKLIHECMHVSTSIPGPGFHSPPPGLHRLESPPTRESQVFLLLS